MTISIGRKPPEWMRRAWRWLRRTRSRMIGRDCPEWSCVLGPSRTTIEFLETTDCRTIAEIGVYRGDTSERLSELLGGRGELHLFDFEERVQAVKRRLTRRGFRNVVAHGNSHRILDSYNWSLMKLLRDHQTPIFDYVFIDGAHTWALDALAFLLVDRLLKTGGYVDFDDYDWSLAVSPSQRPDVFPATRRLFTDEQIHERHVSLIVDLLVRRDPRYREIVENRIFRKVASHHN
jgi:predicted O-methyltransferase YrrM